MSIQVTLVLGAGASMAFRYPSGEGLRSLIVSLGDSGHHQFCSDVGLLEDEEHFHEFIEAFKLSDQGSIDAFLARRLNFSEIGRRCIAAVLLRCEGTSRLMVPQGEDWWPTYLHRIFSADTWERIDYGTLRIVSFNYDRALEHYLLQSIIHSYGKSEREAIEKLADLRIEHVYGSLGPTLPGAPGYIPYGAAVTADAVRFAASELKVIQEGRDDDASLLRARQYLSEVSNIVFLGFGFDMINMGRLHATTACSKRVARDGKTPGKTVLATCFGMTVAEARWADSYFVGTHIAGNDYPDGFFPSRCIDLLRETRVFGYG